MASLNRRQMLRLGTVAGVGLVTDPGRALKGTLRLPEATDAALARVPFYGPQQAGIATPSQGHLAIAAFDVTARTHTDLRDLLRGWSAAAAALCQASASQAMILRIGCPALAYNDTQEDGIIAASLVSFP